MSVNINKNKLSIKNRYRPEIDGLRAFAVVAVIINHFNKDILPGAVSYTHLTLPTSDLV